MSKRQPATAYPTPTQYQQWTEEAEQYDMSVSEYIQAMTEAGRKKFTPRVEPDEEYHEIRQQRNDLKTELDKARERITELEHQLHQDEREAIQNCIEQNPGAEFEEIVQYVIDSVPARVNRHLEALEGDTIRAEGSGYYAAKTDPEEET